MAIYLECYENCAIQMTCISAQFVATRRLELRSLKSVILNISQLLSLLTYRAYYLLLAQRPKHAYKLCSSGHGTPQAAIRSKQTYIRLLHAQVSDFTRNLTILRPSSTKRLKSFPSTLNLYFPPKFLRVDIHSKWHPDRSTN